MDNREQKETGWNEVTGRLRRMRDVLELSLEEAQQFFAAAPNEPFSPRAVQAMVANVRGRQASSEFRILNDVLADLVFTSDAKGALDDEALDARALENILPGGRWHELCGIVGWQPWMVLNELVTDFDSTSIDTRAVRWTRQAVDVRFDACTDPIILDVWTGCDELAMSQIRTVREGTVRWDARLEATGVDLLEDAVTYSTGFDFADYDDEAIEGVLRN